MWKRNDTTQEPTADTKPFSLASRISLGVLALAVVAYTVFHISTLFQTDMTTIAAGKTTEYTTVNASGYIFRDETVLYSENRGAVDYRVSDGEKVSLEQTLAYVYEGQNGEDVRKSLRLIDQQIAVLEQSSREAVKYMDISEAYGQTGDSHADLVKMLASGDLGGLDEAINGMLVGMNRADVISSEEQTVAERKLEELYETRSFLLSGSNPKQHKSEDVGYFYSVVDGYEQSFTLDAALRLTPERFYSMLFDRDATTLSDGRMAYGKLAANSEWNFVIPMSSAEAAYFTEGQTYDVTFFRSSNLSLPMVLEQIIGSEEGEEVLLRFFCDRLPSGFAFNRCEDVGIVVDQVSGMYVPEDAVEYVDGRVGVYILRGSVVQFRCIQIVYEGNGYYLVAEEPSEEAEDVSYLAPNDLIILNGHQLFDGRIMD